MKDNSRTFCELVMDSAEYGGKAPDLYSALHFILQLRVLKILPKSPVLAPTSYEM